jgi:hypothetical protein
MLGRMLHVDTARKILKEIPFEFVLLHPSIGVCLERAGSHKEGAITDTVQLKNFYPLFEHSNTEAICDDDAGPASLALRIAEELKQGRFRV